MAHVARNFCGQCGARTTPEQRFCERCGHRLGGERAEEIPRTRLAMPKPAVLPTMPTPPGPTGAPARAAEPARIYSGAPARAAEPSPLPVYDFEPPRRRRRRWPWIVLACLVALASSAVAGWFAAPVWTRGLAARFALPTFVGDAEVGALPLEGGEEARFDVRRVSLPSRPADATLATPVFDISPRSPGGGPYEISLPLLDPSDERPVVVGHYTDGRWELLATEVAGGRAIAVTESLSPFAGWFVPVHPPRSPAEAAGLSVAPPRVLYGEAGDPPRIVFDLRGSRYARDRRPFGPLYPVVALRVEVNEPEGDRPAPSPNRFRPYLVGGQPLGWDPREAEATLSIPLVPLSRGYDHVTPVSYRRWDLRVVPVFADGSVGSPSAPVSLYPDVLRALTHMNREAPFDPGLRATFDQRVAATPVRVVFGGYAQVRDAYNGSLAWSRRRGWGRLFGGVAGPNMGITLEATYGDVVTHEWGHYAAHMALGDEYEATSPGGAHNGWVESTRALAFTEDLATFLGQWATGAGVPPAAGAMFGRTRTMSRVPEGEGPRWPRHRDCDAIGVETVPATVMSRLAHDIGFAPVFSTIAAARPRDLVELCAALGPERSDVLQPILIDEGVSFLVQGRVVEITDDPARPRPVVGATVYVRTLGGVDLPTPEADRALVRPVTVEGGRFTVRVPPGEVLLVAEAPGLTQRNRVTFSADATMRTNNREPQRALVDLEMERGLEVIIESPAPGATVTERIQVVRGRVEMRAGTSLETVTLSTGGAAVQAPLTNGRFEGRVTLAPGQNTITATARTDRGESSASVTVNAEIPATVLMCELTWNRDRTDVDLWVTDPEGVTTGFRDRQPRAGRLLDVDNTRGYGPETYTMSADVPGAYQVRVNYYSGRDPVGFRVRWCVRESTPEQRCGEETGTLSAADRAGSSAAGNHRFTVTVPPSAAR